MNYRYLIGLFIAVLLMMAIGCSNSTGNPIAPESQSQNMVNPSSHELGGFWIFNLDETTMNLTIEPDRDMEWHALVTKFLLPPSCPDCIRIKLNSWNPATRILNADVTIKNQYLIIAYDLRGIVYTDDYGMTLTNADGWTGLHDLPDGRDINPFKAYAKDATLRAFVPYAEHAENFRIYAPVGSVIRYAVDVSVNGNCEEPYSIENFHHTRLTDEIGSTADITVDVLDWQNDVDSVALQCPEITGDPETPSTLIIDNTWGVSIVNNTGAPAGAYETIIVTKSTGSGFLAAYNIVNIHVKSNETGFYETEANNTWQDADPLPMEYDPESDGFMYTGMILSEVFNDEDWYMIDLKKSQLGIILICKDLESYGELTLTLYDSSLNAVDSHTVTGQSCAWVNTPYGVGDNAGTYYIKVNGDSMLHYDLAPLRWPNWDEGFTFFETEPNNNSAQANAMSLDYDPDTDDNNYTGEYPSSRTDDWFRLDIPWDGILAIHLMDYDCASNEKMYITLYNSSLTQLDSGEIWYDDGNVCIDANVRMGTYFVKVNGNTYTHRYAFEPIWIED